MGLKATRKILSVIFAVVIAISSMCFIIGLVVNLTFATQSYSEKLVDNGKRTIAEISADISNHDRVKNPDGTYRHVKGLTNRRNKEKELFDTPKYRIGWSHDADGWWYSEDGKQYLWNTWKVINKHKYYFNSLGYAVTEWEKIDGKWYYFEPYGESQCALYVSDKDGAQHVGEFDE